jgi:RimJ/RimL family protein N-acetyltransferase
MKLRPATLDDAELLFQWRNDPTTIAMSFGSKGVTWGEHLGWLSRRLADQAPLYIFEDNQHRPVGTARIDGDELSYTIAPEFRGRGLAVLMLSWVRIKHGRLKCLIKPVNIASIMAARKAGHQVIVVPSRD